MGPAGRGEGRLPRRGGGRAREHRSVHPAAHDHAPGHLGRRPAIDALPVLGDHVHGGRMISALLAAAAASVATPFEPTPAEDPVPALAALGPQPAGATAVT